MDLRSSQVISFTTALLKEQGDIWSFLHLEGEKVRAKKSGGLKGQGGMDNKQSLCFSVLIL